jgi:hypothetical protein
VILARGDDAEGGISVVVVVVAGTQSVVQVQGSDLPSDGERTWCLVRRRL